MSWRSGSASTPATSTSTCACCCKAGLIELADSEGRGREKPYRAVAKVFRVAPELLSAGGASDLQAAMIDQVQRAHALYSAGGTFRGAQLELKLSMERALELMSAFLDGRARPRGRERRQDRPDDVRAPARRDQD